MLNYLEANESISKKDFIHRLKISKKEAKETCYWLKLTKPQPAFTEERLTLIDEATQLMNILGAILIKAKS